MKLFKGWFQTKKPENQKTWSAKNQNLLSRIRALRNERDRLRATLYTCKQRLIEQKLDPKDFGLGDIDYE